MVRRLILLNLISSLIQWEDRLDDSVFAISGKISIELSEYKGLPVINAMTSIEQLVDLIEEKAIEYSHGDEI